MKTHQIVILAVAMMFELSAYAQEKSPPPKPLATIAAIDGRTVTIQSYEGRTMEVSVRSVENLKIGQHTSWCEEDCRVINVWVPLQVEGIKQGK